MERTYKPTDFINRELSWLEFNKRVLEESEDEGTPLLERLKFIAITSSNLDEFFMVRVAGLNTQYEEGITKKDIAGLTPREQLVEIRKSSQALVERIYSSYSKIIENLETQGHLRIRPFDALTGKQKKYIKAYYNEVIFPILTPMGVDAARPFPHINTGTLNLIVKIRSDGKTGPRYSVIQVPRVVKRLIELPVEESREFILLEEVISAMGKGLFCGYEVEEMGVFRVTRSGDMIIDEEEADDLLLEIEKELRRRRWGTPVRTECSVSLGESSKNFLRERTGLPLEDFYEVKGPVDLTFLWELFEMEGFEDIKFQRNYPFFTKKLQGREVFANLLKKRYLLHHPYDTFDHVAELIETAAEDKKVLAIKQTLYRVSGNSAVIKALMMAAQNGKQVTVVVELKARFDEEKNIKWAKKLERAGCHVIYGLKGLKVHAKCLLIIRREEEGIKRYLHLGTGNYNNLTAKLYSDFSYFTCDTQMAMDISNLFNKLTGFSTDRSWKKVAAAPDFLRDEFYRLIEREKKNAELGREGRIVAKMNSLVDMGIIQKLYDASRAGVEIELIVRGACCLRGGVEGLSENIRVSSLVGRYLEHSRIYSFYSNGEEEIYLSSADWMKRNLDRRVELLFPIEDKESKKKISQILERLLRDNVKLRRQKIDGTYERAESSGEPFNAQDSFFRDKINGKR